MEMVEILFRKGMNLAARRIFLDPKGKLLVLSVCNIQGGIFKLDGQLDLFIRLELSLRHLVFLILMANWNANLDAYLYKVMPTDRREGRKFSQACIVVLIG